jgi:glutamate-ammonia-ligase adenylyltransferase
MSWDDAVERLVEAVPFADPDRARRNLHSLRGEAGEAEPAPRSLLPALAEGLGAVADPDMALNNLERFAGAVLSRPVLFDLFREARRVLDLTLTVFGSSQFLADILVRHPQLLAWLLEPGVLRGVTSRAALAEELAAATAERRSVERQWEAMRRFKSREILRIGLQDLLGNLDLAGVTAALSDLADVILQRAVTIADAELRARFGEPRLAGPDGPRRCRFVVLGLGKLGGRELNFSSDVDLMFVYEDEGETTGVARPGGGRAGVVTNQEYCRRLGEALSRAVGEVTAEGHLFRVDLRLRPEGRSGPVAASLARCAFYYGSYRQTWERLALIKARPIAGDLDLGEAFLRLVAPFAYPPALEPRTLAEVRAMKDKITLGVSLEGKERRHVKLGYGGIREIEFIAQSFQVRHGGRDPWLRTPNTLIALHRVAGRGFVSTEEYTALVRAYTFLRTVEHRLQILHQLQTHVLPEAPAALGKLARRLGFGGRAAEPAEAFLREYRRHTEAVRRVYDRLLADAPAPTAAAAGGPLARFFLGGAPDGELRAHLGALGCEEVQRAVHNLVALRDGSALVQYGSAVRHHLAGLAPALAQALREAPDPDMALNHFERLVAVAEAREAFLAALAGNPDAVRLLARLFGTSAFLSRRLIQEPSLLEVLLDPELFRRASARDALATEIWQAVAGADGPSGRLEALCRIKKREELRIGLRDILGDADLAETGRDLTALAEACVEAACRLAWDEARQRFGAPLAGEDGGRPGGYAVVGLGKLGGGELNYASDLDLLFVYEEDGRTAGGEEGTLSAVEFFGKLGARAIRILTTITQEGAAYRVDARLRPGGNQGPLAQSLAAYAAHFRQTAELWERQAYLRARPLFGDPRVAAGFAELTAAFTYGPGLDADAAARIRAMRQRMEEERARGRGGRDVKLGAGGIADVEFLVQALQLRHGGAIEALRTPNTAGALSAVEAERLLPAAEARTLAEGYRFLRRVEARLRIVADLSLDTLPVSAGRLGRLARRLGYQGPAPAEAFLADYAEHTGAVRALFDRLFAARC